MNRAETDSIGRYFPISSSPRELMARAREITAVDFLDDSIEEALTRLLHSFNTEARLNERGALAMKRHMLRVLCNRLRMQRDLAAHPEISDEKIINPLFIVGGPRTGSTKLQKLLAASGDFLFLQFWQGHALSLRSGHRGEDPAQRIREADEYIAWMNEHAPNAQRNHGYSTFEAEEETLIGEHSLCSVFLSTFAELPSYMEWVAGSEFRNYVKFLKLGLQYLQWQFHAGDGRSWVLKCPIYSGVEPLLAEVLPGARFISTHRHPLSSVPSTINLVNGYRDSCSDVDWRRPSGAAFLEGLAIGTERAMMVRDRHPHLNIRDVRYSTLTANAKEIVDEVYAHIGSPLTAEARERVLDWDTKHPAPRHDGKAYSLADFGLSEQMINSRFSMYIERFSNYF